MYAALDSHESRIYASCPFIINLYRKVFHKSEVCVITPCGPHINQSILKDH